MTSQRSETASYHTEECSLEGLKNVDPAGREWQDDAVGDKMNRTKHVRYWAVILMGLLALGSLALIAQQPQSEQREGPLKRKEQKKDDQDFTLRVDVPIVNLDVSVVDRNGNTISGLQPHHFRVFVDKKEVEVTAFAPTEAPITVVMLVEANPSLGYYLTYNNLEAVALFLRQLQKDDWIALVGYDMKSRIEADFTQDQREIMQALQRMQYPAGFRESNFYDALLDTLDRIKDVEGRKAIIYIGRGIDTFSKKNWGDTRKVLREHDAIIFAIGMTWLSQLRNDQYEAAGYNMAISRMTLNLAEAQLKDITKKTGGKAYFPRFQAELPNIYQQVGAVLRSQYSLAIRPSEFERDGKFHKFKVKLVNPLNGEKLKVVDQNGKNVKYKVFHREGFYAPKG